MKFAPLIASLALLSGFPSAASADLLSYVKRPEPDYGWKLESKTQNGPCDIWHLKLTSQVWQDIKWEHDLVVFRPKDQPPVEKVYLLNTGGQARARDAAYGSMIAARMKAPVAFVLGVPNQPLFGGKKEDDLIAETFCRFLETKDENWPLLFPMTKSVVKAMDAVQEFSEKEWKSRTEKFIVGGASKRGWTTWLTAAVDPRVIAITPMVIDTLNFGVQLPHQFKCFGGPSEQIKPYTERGLVPMPDTAEARKLWSMVDPWHYRDRYTMPKLISCGNNDRYWTTDALNLYWDDLPGDKYISYSPNAGHDLTERLSDGSRGDAFRALNNVCGFVRHILTDKPMPIMTWKHDELDGQLRLNVMAAPQPLAARLWTATSATPDFRESRWSAAPLEIREGKIEARVDRPAEGYIAYYADLNYQIEDIPQWLCTQLRVVSPQ
ncbi:MAG: PhoPQ-activated pathogenicity-related family protein [Verrucomicrobiales bacterium]